MKSYSSSEIISIIEKDGWRKVRTTGDHHQFRHATKPGTVTVRDPVKDLSKNELDSIQAQSQINLRELEKKKASSKGKNRKG